jgi:hypothetical protein
MKNFNSIIAYLSPKREISLIFLWAEKSVQNIGHENGSEV